MSGEGTKASLLTLAVNRRRTNACSAHGSRFALLLLLMCDAGSPGHRLKAKKRCCGGSGTAVMAFQKSPNLLNRLAGVFHKEPRDGKGPATIHSDSTSLPLGDMSGSCAFPCPPHLTIATKTHLISSSASAQHSPAYAAGLHAMGAPDSPISGTASPCAPPQAASKLRAHLSAASDNYLLRRAVAPGAQGQHVGQLGVPLHSLSTGECCTPMLAVPRSLHATG